MKQTAANKAHSQSCCAIGVADELCMPLAAQETGRLDVKSAMRPKGRKLVPVLKE